MIFDENIPFKCKIKHASTGCGLTSISIVDMLEKMYRNPRMLIEIVLTEDELIDEENVHLYDVIEDLLSNHNRFKNFTANEKLMNYTYVRIYYSLGEITHGEYRQMIHELNEYYRMEENNDFPSGELYPGTYPAGTFTFMSGTIVEGTVSGMIRILDNNAFIYEEGFSNQDGNFFVRELIGGYITNATIENATIMNNQTGYVYENVSLSVPVFGSLSLNPRQGERGIHIMGPYIQYTNIEADGQNISNATIVNQVLVNYNNTIGESIING